MIKTELALLNKTISDYFKSRDIDLGEIISIKMDSNHVFLIIKLHFKLVNSEVVLIVKNNTLEIILSANINIRTTDLENLIIKTINFTNLQLI